MKIEPDLNLLSVEEALPLANAQPGAWNGRIAVLSRPVPRDQVDLPISRHAPPTDQHLFDDPGDGAKKYWLPRYRLAEETVSGRQRYRLGFVEKDGGWRLMLRLVTVPPPGLEEAALAHPILPHELGIELSYAVLGAARTRKTAKFQELIQDDEGVDAELILSGLAHRDEVFQALSDGARQSRLTIYRKVRVAIEERAESAELLEAGRVLLPIRPIAPIPIQPIHPVRPVVPVRPQKLATPKLSFAGTQRYKVRNTPFVRYRLRVTNWNAYTAGHFKASPNLPPCGSNKNAARCWVDILDSRTNKRIYGFCALKKPADLTELWFARKADQAPPAAVRIKLTDRLAKVSRVSNSVAVKRAPPPEPVFRVLEATIDQVAEPSPFTFSRDLHGYVFDSLVGGSGPGPQGGLVRHRESFSGAVHSYFQDPAEREVFYHLPDDFRIGRRGGPVRAPFITLRVRTIGGSTESAQATLDFVVVPVTDPARLEAARLALAERARIDPAQVSLQPYVTTDVRFFVQRPTATGRFDEERPGGALILQGPVFDTLGMPLTDFQMAFDAMMGRTASLFGGRVEIDVEGSETEARPFIADFAALAGPILDVAAREVDGEFSVSLTNAIESPVVLGDLVFRAARGGASAELRPTGAAREEAELAPGDRAEFSMPIPALPGAGRINVSVASGIRVRPDDAAVLDAILDRSTLEYFREIEVRAHPSLFQPIPDRPNDQIEEILVDFDGGDTIALTSSSPTGTARVDFPFDDVILRETVDARYRYRKTVVRVDGTLQSDPEPIENDVEILFVQVIR